MKGELDMKWQKLWIYPLCLSMLLTACAPAPVSSSEPQQAVNSGETSEPAAPAPSGASAASSSEPGSQKTEKLPAAVGGVLDAQGVGAVNGFGFRLYEQLYKEDENTFLSPVSIYLAFGMLQNGAAGESAEQLGNLLGQQDTAVLNAFCQQLQKQLLEERGETDMRLSNSLWMRESAAKDIRQEFVDAVQSAFSAHVEALDFDSAEAAGKINNWIKSNTNGLIEKLIEGEIDPNTVMYLVNTIYFKAQWEDAFDPGRTREQDFHAPSGDIKVQMMRREANFDYLENDQYQAIRLPYKDGKTSMIVLLPREGETNFLKTVNAGLIESVLADLVSRKVFFGMPKMDLQYGTSLIDAMKALGVTDVFEENADLSGITGDQSLYVSSAVHKTALKVDEEGTEAAGMTGLGIAGKSMALDQTVMVCDRPFYAAIVDNETGLILFGGAIMSP
ncbi:serpin family protein [Anaerotruncus sp. AF02-27]|nr:serpin family protein [Anaerotruncus sp. AF02-27]